MKLSTNVQLHAPACLKTVTMSKKQGICLNFCPYQAQVNTFSIGMLHQKIFPAGFKLHCCVEGAVSCMVESQFVHGLPVDTMQLLSGQSPAGHLS